MNATNEAKEKGKRGRPRVIEGQVRELLIGLVGMGCSRKQAARHVGVGPRTLFKKLSEDEEFATQMRRAEMQQDITPLRKILEHSPTSWRAAAWILERQNPNRYARRPPMMYSHGDCMALLQQVLDYAMKGACDEDLLRVTKHLERLAQLLGGQDATTPRGRRVMKAMSAAEETSCTVQRGAENAENTRPRGEIAPFEQGGDI